MPLTAVCTLPDQIGRRLAGLRSPASVGRTALLIAASYGTMPRQSGDSAMAKQILSLANPRSIDGGAALQFTLHTDDGQTELVVPSVEIGKILQFFASCARVIGDEIDDDAPPTNDLFPIPASGVGFQEGPTPDTALLVVSLSGFGLGFEFPSSKLADMARGIGQTALTLSARPGRSN